MTDREMADRETARLSGIGEVLEEEDRPETNISAISARLSAICRR